MVVKKAPPGGPPVAGAPIPGLKDGKGRPPPWPGGPQLEVRLVLPGAGESNWGDESLGAWDPLGTGAAHAVAQGQKAEDVLTGRVRYTAIDRRAAEKITYDYVKGAFAGKPELEVSAWGHAEAVHVAYGLVYAFRGWPPREPGFRWPDDPRPPEVIEEGPGAVCFILPEVARGFESKDTKGSGGFFRGHGAVMHSYTTYVLPAGPGRSGLAAFEMNDVEFMGRKPPAGAPEPPRMVNRRRDFDVFGRFLLSSSQTTAEAQPRVRVIALSD